MARRNCPSRGSACSRESRLASARRFLLLGAIVISFAVSLPTEAQAELTFRQQLTKLAEKCEELGLHEQATRSREWFIERDPGRQTIFLPSESELLQPPADQPQLVQYWWKTFHKMRRLQADKLFEQAQQELAAGESTRAYGLLHEVLHENPDHAKARAALGYRVVNDRWRRPAAEMRVRQPRTAHGTTRWPVGSYWRIETEHYDISTNLSAVAGEQLGQRLEMLHEVWRQLFFTYWSDAKALEFWIENGQSVRRSPTKHKVILFANREQYVRMLSAGQPRAAITLGIYMDRRRTAFFFAGEDSTRATQYHEAGHQLFQEVGRLRGRVGERDNFWLVEGVALYLESLRPYEGYATVGGFDANRLQFARYRALNQRFYLPLADLCTLGRAQLQQHQNIRQLYSQAAGLAHFLIDHEGGKHRQALDQYLKFVYADNTDRGTLAKLAGVDYEQLDQEYRQFLNVTDADLQHLAAPQYVRRLTLGHTEVTDAGLKQLAGYDQLIWLDLTGRPITDAGFASLAESLALEQLSLDRTAVGNDSLKLIGRMRELTELDLSATKVTTAGLAELTGLSQLESLWLTGTSLTDAAVEPLSRLKSLHYVNVNKAGISAEAWGRLKRQLPQLGVE